MKKKFLALALVLALAVSSTMPGIAAPSPSENTNPSTDRGSSGGGGGGGSSNVIGRGVSNITNQGTFAASTSNGDTTTTADGATKTSESKEIVVEGASGIYENGTVKGAGLDIELQSAVITNNGVTYTALVNKGTIDDKTVDYRIQLIKTINGRTVGLILDPSTNQFMRYSGDLVIVLADGSKKTVHVTNGMFVF